MKKSLVATFAITALSISIPAIAVDWGGLYAGGNVGYGWGNGDIKADPTPTAAIFVNFQPTTLSPNPDGALLGGQIGYNWMIGNILAGIEADLSWSGIRGSTTRSPITQNNGTPFPGVGNNVRSSEDIRDFSTLRGRFGFLPADNWLVYGTGGLAVANVKYEANTDFRPVGTEQYPVATSRTKAGWTLGLGAEWRVFDRTSIKAEYLYYDFGKQSSHADAVPALPPFGMDYSWKTSGSIVRLGANYKF